LAHSEDLLAFSARRQRANSFDDEDDLAGRAAGLAQPVRLGSL